jgi:chromate transporter
MNDNGLLGRLAINFLTISLLAFGGANAVVPEMHRQAVDVAHWMSDREFAALFAIAQAAPGPNVMIVTLIGWHVAGLAGAFVATGAMVGPSWVLTYGVYSAWSRFRHLPWLATVQNGLTPVTVGLVFSSAFLIARAADTGLLAIAVTAATGALCYWTRLNPLWAFAAAAVLGGAGLI